MERLIDIDGWLEPLRHERCGRQSSSLRDVLHRSCRRAGQAAEMLQAAMVLFEKRNRVAVVAAM
jgi:hypothetical protein